MKNRKFIISIVLVILVIGIIFFFIKYMKISKAQNTTNDEINISNNTDIYENKTDVFSAKIKKIRKLGEKTDILVEGLDKNDINHKGEFTFIVNESTKITWGTANIKVTDLKVGMNISIISTGEVLERSPEKITKVIEINVLDAKL